MGDRKNIDRLFREKFKHFEAAPGAHVWSAIEKKMGGRKKDRRVFPFILKYGSIAAAMALLITLGYNLNPSDNNFVDPVNITNIDPKENANDNNTPTVLTENTAKDQDNAINPLTNKVDGNSRLTPVKSTLVSNTNRLNNADENADVMKNSETAMTYSETDVAAQDRFEQNNNEIVNRPLTKENTEVVDAENKKSLLEVLQEQSNLEEEEVVAGHTVNKWSINPNAAPVYFNSLDNGSPIADQFRDNAKSGNITVSYGLSVAYQVNNRLSVRSGINKVSYGYNTNNIEFTPALQAGNLSTISYKNDAENIMVTDVNTPQAPPPGSPVTANKAVAYEGRMVQEFGYLEVPLEIKYRLLNKKLGINVIGGVSSLFLTDNTISVQTNALNAQIGQANNINELNFSTNIGLGIDYKVSDEVLFNVEPMFKYQLNTFSSDQGGFKPYSLGVYTGLSFRF